MAIVNTTNVTSKHLLTQMGFSYSDSTKYNAQDLFITEGKRYGVKWAKYKPVKHTSEHHAHTNTDSEYPNWWKADGYCGLSIPKYESTSSIVNVSDPDSLWTIDRPVLGTNPFRLGDFAGYANGIGGNDYAVPVIRFEAPTITKVASGSAGQVFVTFSQDAESLDIIQDMTGLKDMYLGLILKASNFVSYFTMDRKVSASSWNDDTTLKYYTDGAYFELPAKALGASKSYTAYLCLFNSMRTDPESNNLGGDLTVSYIPMPIAPITITVTDVADYYSLTGNSLSFSGYNLVANITIKNTSSSSLTLQYSSTMTDGEFYLQYYVTKRGYDSDGAMGEITVREKQPYSVSITVPANSSKTVDMTVYSYSSSELSSAKSTYHYAYIELWSKGSTSSDKSVTVYYEP